VPRTALGPDPLAAVPSLYSARMWPTRIDRYLWSELAPPLVLGFASYTFLFVVRELFNLLEIAVASDMPLALLGRMLAWSLPWIVVLTLPMSFLLAILVGIGRLSSESEMTALRASGISFRRVLLSILPVALAVAALDVWLMVRLLPSGNRHLSDTRFLQMAAKRMRIQPREFRNLPGERALWIDDVEPDSNRWLGLFLADRADPAHDRLIVASSGSLRADQEQKKTWVDLGGTATYEVDVKKPEMHTVTFSSRQSIVLTEEAKGEVRRKYSPRSLDNRELRRLARADDTSPERRREALTEIQKRYSIPAAAVAFLLVGLPLGLGNRRGGRGSGFAASIALVALYYVLLNTGQDLSISGKVPGGFGIWLPNLVFLALGALFVYRLERELPAFPSFPFGAALARLRRAAPAPKAPAGAALQPTPALELLQPTPFRHPERRKARFSIAFWPTLLDRYVGAMLLRFFLLIAANFIVLYAVVDYTQIADKFAREHFSLGDVLAYYRLFSFEILHQTAPFAFLVAGLVTLGVLERRLELAAIRSTGTSLHRLAVPLLVGAVALAGLDYLYLDRVLPWASAERAKLKARLDGNKLGSGDERGWFASSAGTLVSFRGVDRDSGVLLGVSAFLRDQNHLLAARYEAERARRVEGGWSLSNGWERIYSGGFERSYRRFTGEMSAPFDESLESITAVAQETLSPSRLAEKIDRLERAGFDVRSLRNTYWQRRAAPFSAVVLSLLAIPFAVRFGRRGTMAGIGVGLGLGLGFLATVELFGKLAEGGALPAALASFSPHVLFGLAGLWFLLGTEN
jgi:LPS export ABC transporter permease LptG/LPS export ABC transporter permease LptF